MVQEVHFQNKKKNRECNEFGTKKMTMTHSSLPSATIGSYFGGNWIQFPSGSFIWLLSEANDRRNSGAWITRKSLQTIYGREQ